MIAAAKNHSKMFAPEEDQASREEAAIARAKHLAEEREYAAFAEWFWRKHEKPEAKREARRAAKGFKNSST